MTMGFGFCPNCGTPRVAAEQRFCAGCGGALSPVAPPAPQVPEPPQSQAREPIAAPVPSEWTSPMPPPPTSEPVPAAEAPAAPPPWAARPAVPPAEALAAQPVAPPAWSMPAAAAATPPPPWAMPPAAPGAPTAQAAPPVYPGTPAPAPAPIPRAPGTPIATVAGIKVTPKLLAIAGIVLAVVVAIVYVTMGSKSAGISVTPSSFSCSSSIQVASAIKLPSSLRATDTIVLTVDGAVQNTTTVGAYMNHQGDGSWTREQPASAHDACQGANGQLSMGTHTVKILDVGGHLIAEGSFTLTP